MFMRNLQRQRLLDIGRKAQAHAKAGGSITSFIPLSGTSRARVYRALAYLEKVDGNPSREELLGLPAIRKDRRASDVVDSETEVDELLL